MKFSPLFRRQRQVERLSLLVGIILAILLFLIRSLESFCPLVNMYPKFNLPVLEAMENEIPTEKPTSPLPSCARGGTRAQTFLMVFMGHSGSSAIISELAAHSQVYFEDEFEPVDHYEYEFNTTLALQWTRDYFRRGIGSGKTPGFKMRPNHIKRDPAAWVALAREFDTRIIWQYRHNIFKVAVGEYTLRNLNDSSVVEGLRRKMTKEERCKIGAGCRFRVDKMRSMHALLRNGVDCDEKIANAVHLIADGRDCVFGLPYEDYLYSREETMRRLHVFLGLRQESHAPKRFKATSDNMCEAIVNWDEVCENFYACHSWRSMMDDDRNQCYCNFKTGPTSFCATA